MRHVKRVSLSFLLIVGLIAGQGGVVLAQDADSSTIGVGSLGFTESIILGEMISLLLEDAGYEVDRKLDLGTSADAHGALLAGEIDVYVEYTGGGLVAILGLPVPTGVEEGPGTPVASIADQTYHTVAGAYRDQFGLVWLDLIGFNNSYTMAVTAETAEAYDLATVSDLAEHAGEMTLGTDEEFPDRQDGLPGLEAIYELEFGTVEPGDPALMYEAIERGDVDVITAYTTDFRVSELDLVVLGDDQNFFPPYHAAPVIDGALLEETPEIGIVINQLAGTIDNATMAELNAQVDDGGMAPIDVARAYLEHQGLIEPTP
jgi:glycine betaine/choline ABC-type transport system substrate-binding protein